MAKAAKAGRNRHQEARAAIEKSWGPKTADMFPHLTSSTGLSALRGLARKGSLQVAIPYINEALIHRLRNPGRGVSNSREIQPSNLNLATDRLTKVTGNQPVSVEVAILMGLGYADSGLLTPMHRLPAIQGRAQTVIEGTPAPTGPRSRQGSIASSPLSSPPKSPSPTTGPSSPKLPFRSIEGVLEGAARAGPVTRSQTQTVAQELAPSTPRHQRAASIGGSSPIDINQTVPGSPINAIHASLFNKTAPTS